MKMQSSINAEVLKLALSQSGKNYIKNSCIQIVIHIRE